MGDFSPVLHKGTAKTMSFPVALQELINGRRITRLEWSSNEEYGFLKNETLCIHTKNSDHVWAVSLGDLKANDWTVLPQLN